MKCLCHFSSPCPKTIGVFNKLWPEEPKILSRTKTDCNCVPGYNYDYGMYFHARTCSITKQPSRKDLK
jgi:hypothetical protein